MATLESSGLGCKLGIPKRFGHLDNFVVAQIVSNIDLRCDLIPVTTQEWAQVHFRTDQFSESHPISQINKLGSCAFFSPKLVSDVNSIGNLCESFTCSPNRIQIQNRQCKQETHKLHYILAKNSKMSIRENHNDLDKTPECIPYPCALVGILTIRRVVSIRNNERYYILFFNKLLFSRVKIEKRLSAF